MSKSRAKQKPREEDMQLYRELLELCATLELRVRTESGTFHSGFCVHQDEEMMILNRRLEIPQRNVLLARHLAPLVEEQTQLSDQTREYLRTFQSDQQAAAAPTQQENPA